MVKGFSESEFKNDKPTKDFKKEKKGLATFLKGKKFTYTLPGKKQINICLLYTSPSPRDLSTSRMPSSA